MAMMGRTHTDTGPEKANRSTTPTRRGLEEEERWR